MILMHYRFTLPADYDMSIIEQRIARNGASLDGFPGLLFKAYLYARRDDGARENRYAPLYLWRDAAGMRQFLASAGFARLAQDFGWPTIHLWLALNTPDSDALRQARVMTLRHTPLAPWQDLAQLGSAAALAGWDIPRQSLLEVDLSADSQSFTGEAYRIGYLARGAPLCETR